MQALQELYDGFMTNRRVMGLAEGTFKFYAKKLIPFMEWCEIQDPPIDLSNLHEDHIDQYQAHEFDRGCNAGGVGASSRAIRTFVNFGYKRKHLARKLEVSIPKNGHYKPRFLTHEEIDRLYEAIDTGLTRMVERDRAILSLMLDCGSRKGAIVALDWKDLSWDVERNIGNVMLQEKGVDKPRTLSHFTRKTWDLLEIYKATLDNSGPGDPVVISEKTVERLSGNGLHQWIVRLSKRTGIDIRLHGLRHTFGRQQALRLPLPVLQQMMGHKQISTTMIYATPDAEMVADAYAKVENED